MVLDRHPALVSMAGVLAGLVVAGTLAGCGGSHGDTPQPTTSIAATATSSGLSTPSSPAEVSPSGSAAGSPSTSISIPPDLCTGTDVAQNAADAYMGALSAGQLAQASACVLPGTVPASVTRGLLASAGQQAVYLPRDGVDGPSVFGYRGNGKLVDVTVTKEQDGRFWVTAVTVRNG